jgi:hypothetical protein
LAPTVGIAATGFCYLGGILQLFHRRYQQIFSTLSRSTNFAAADSSKQPDRFNIRATSLHKIEDNKIISDESRFLASARPRHVCVLQLKPTRSSFFGITKEEEASSSRSDPCNSPDGEQVEAKKIYQTYSPILRGRAYIWY